MATRAIQVAPAPTLPLNVLLGSLPSLPRPILSRLVARMIDRIDEMDGDPDLEAIDEREWIDEREPEPWEGGYGDERPTLFTCLNR